MNLLEQFQEVKSKAGGLKKFKVDLHIHTPASKDSKWAEDDPAKILRSLWDSGLDLVAITDHFSGEYIDKLNQARKFMKNRREFKERALPKIIPGVEIEIRGVHLLCLFPENKTSKDISYFLSRLRIEPSKWGDEKANCTAGIDEVRNEVNSLEGIIVAAHCNSNKGLFKISGKDFDDIYASIDVFEMNKSDLAKNISYLKARKGDIAMKPFIQSSDAHQESDLGRNEFYLRLDSPNFLGVKQIIFEPLLRSVEIESKISIIGMRINSDRGIYRNESFKFNNSLNVIIGGRGSGKSIFVDTLRYALNEMPSDSDLVSKDGGLLSRLFNTYEEGDSISVFLEINSSVYCCIRPISINKIRREFSQTGDSRWYIYEAGDFSLVDRPLISFIIYSQREIEKLTTQADKVGDICDDYSPEVLKMKANEILLVESLDVDIKEREDINKLSDAISSKSDRHIEVIKEVDRYESLLKEIDSSVYNKMNKAESETNNYIKSVKSRVDMLRANAVKMTSELAKLRDNFLISDQFITEEFSHYYSFINKWSIEISEIMSFSIIPSFSTSDARVAWRSKLAEEKTAYEKIIKDSGQESLDMLMPKLDSLRIERENLAKEIDLDKAKIAELEKVEKNIVAKLTALSNLRSAIKSCRMSNIDTVNSKMSRNVYIEYSESIEEYKDFLDDLFKSKGLQDKAGIISKISTVESTDLLKICISGEISSLKALGISESNIAIIVSVIRSASGMTVYRHTGVFMPKYGLEKQERKFNVDELSIGERVSAVFPLLTINSGFPIVLDQPEDDLDHDYIIENIVSTIRDSKVQQQYIIVTHNPNIPVLADADQVIKVSRDEVNRYCFIEMQGGLEKREINERIAQLEGGIAAIKLRFDR